MLSKVYYLIRSGADGHYLVAHPNSNTQLSEPGYLLLFCEHFDALSYLNTHGSNAVAHWAVESISRAQLYHILESCATNAIKRVLGSTTRYGRSLQVREPGERRRP